MKRTVIFVDAGHGGIDDKGVYTTAPSKMFTHTRGAFHNGRTFLEGVSNRNIAAEFMAQASKAGFICIPVYHPFKDTRLTVRTTFANQTAKTLEVESLYFSFHSNAAADADKDGNGDARGVRVFHHPNSTRGKELTIELGYPLAKVFEQYGSIGDNYVREGWLDKSKGQIYHVLEATDMPAVLFELGFFDNRQDAELLVNAEFVSDMIAALVLKMKNYLK